MEGLTLVPLGQAKAGAKFWFTGPNDEECQGCPFQKLCFNLSPGQRYEVTEVRDVRHPCRLHDEDKVQVVKVRPVGFTSTVESKRLRGTAVTWTPIPCGYAECPNWRLCHPTGPMAGERRSVVGDAKPLACPMHYDLQKVTFAAGP